MSHGAIAINTKEDTLPQMDVLNVGKVVSMEITLEITLTALIIIYIMSAIIIASFRCKKYLKAHPIETIGLPYYHHDERNALTFAGFSLTAIALLIGLQFNKLISLASIIQFFSLAFMLMVLSYTFLRFRFVNASIFISDILLNSGLLSIGFGFLVFFAENVSWFDSSTIVFIVLSFALILTSLINYAFFYKYSREQGSKEKDDK